MPLVITESIDVKFRPSNWAERLAGNLATFNQHRLTYSVLAYPTIRNGRPAVVVGDRLKEENPDGYVMLMLFAEDNGLEITEENDHVD